MATTKRSSTRITQPRSFKNASNSKLSAEEVSEESIVIYVHGIGQTDPCDKLKLQWDLALFGRDLGTRSRMAYWADLVRPEVNLGKNTTLRRKYAQSIDSVNIESILNDAGIPESKKAKARDLTMGLLRNVGVPTTATGSIHAKILPLPANLRKPISRAIIQALIKDTSAYFFTPGMRKKMQDRLVKEINLAQSQPVTIIAHSQGSILAYEVLSKLNLKEVDLDALVTIGSPLGIQEVQDFLMPNDPLKVPSVVKRWSNFADPIDPVAFDKNLAGDFDSNGLIEDEVIFNSNTRLQWGFNPHSAVGYLAHPKVRRVVNDAMRMDVMSRFVLARDVAERLSTAPDERHSVLIEVLEPGYMALEESRVEMMVVEKEEIKKLGKGRETYVPALKLEHRVDQAVEMLSTLVGKKHLKSACIDPLRRFVSARLTADELRLVGAAHREMRIYAVWRSSRKAKLTSRSMRVLKADAALASFSADGADITWAVLDTGIRSDHPHFDGVIKEIWDCTKTGRPQQLPADKDADGHGTHVAGIISGKAKKNKSGETIYNERGVAPRTRLVVYKVLDDKGQGEDAWIIKALDHIAEQNENVTGGLAIHGLNLSLGGPFDNTVYGCGFSPICAELRRLWRAGVIVVVASGNEGQMQVQTPDGDAEINSSMSIGDPANLEDCIAVGSVNADRPHLYGVSSFSSRGPTADGRAKPDVVAPGERISSCNARYRSEKDMYYTESGTSMAAPHVSGLLAAFLSVRREFRGRPDEVKKILLESCIDIGRDRYHQGKGIPNLMQMLLAV